MKPQNGTKSTKGTQVEPQYDWRLRVVVFVSGDVLMGLEMTGSRILAIHFGSSIYVWGAIIGVFLATLSIGYYSGGMLADRRPSFYPLNALLLIAGCWLMLIPFYANPVCRLLLRFNPGERLGPLLATLILFGGPSVLLGMVSPYAVRLAAQTVERIGNVSGSLYALSTFGSIAGTLLTAFWLVRPSVVVDLVEIDQRVVDLGLERLRIHVEDGRRFVRRSQTKYDLVILDAFTIGGQIPFHLTTREFFNEIKQTLSPDGVVLTNINGTMRGRRNRIMRSEYKTLATVFPNVYLFPYLHETERRQGATLDPDRPRSLILIACNGGGSWTKESVVATATQLEQSGLAQKAQKAQNDIGLLSDETFLCAFCALCAFCGPLCLFFVRRAQCGYVSHTENAARPDAVFGTVILPVPARRKWRFAAQKARTAGKCARTKLPVSNRQYVAARQQRFHAGTNPK